jgi:hypothetical protein
VKRLRDSWISLEQARWTLAKVWFCGAGMFILVLIAQSFGTIYEGHIPEVWSWALPTVMPTVSLIIAVLRSTALQKNEQTDEGTQHVRRPFYVVTFWLSIFYLALLLGSVLSAPMMSFLHSEETFSPFDAMKLSNLWLAPIQGLVIGCLGTLFFQKPGAGHV